MKAKSTIAPAWPEEVRQLHDMLCMALALPAPDYAKAPRPIQHGVCRSCGQLVTDLGRDFYKQEEADWYATLQCQCPASIRQQAKERAFDNITEIFGDGAAHIAQEPINDTAIDVLCVIAAAVCDSRVEKATLEVKNEEGAVKARIAINAKGIVAIDRTDTQKTQRAV